MFVCNLALHDHIPKIIFLYALSSSPDSRIIDVLHLRDRDKSQTCHIVVQSLFFRNGQTHLMDDRIDLGVILNLILGLEVNHERQKSGTKAKLFFLIWIYTTFPFKHIEKKHVLCYN